MEKKLISSSESYYHDENDIDFKITHGEHLLLLECLHHCIRSYDFSIPLNLVEGYLKEDTLAYSRLECIHNLTSRLEYLQSIRTNQKPYQRIDEYVDEEGNKSYVTIQLDDN